MSFITVEIWKKHPEFTRYEISTLGRVRSLIGTPKILKPGDKAGYRSVALCGNGRERRARIGVLVLETFVGPRPKGMECCHGKLGRTCDYLSNLSWGTHKKNNVQDKIRDGTYGKKLTKSQIEGIVELIRSGKPNKPIAQVYGVRAEHIRRIRSGEIWKSVLDEMGYVPKPYVRPRKPPKLTKPPLPLVDGLPPYLHPLHGKWFYAKRLIKEGRIHNKFDSFEHYVNWAKENGWRRGTRQRIIRNLDGWLEVKRCIHLEPGYELWKRIWQFCNSSGSSGYPSVGKQGIQLCSSWNDFYNFQSWALKQAAELEVDVEDKELEVIRVDKSKDYSPVNCFLA